MLDFFAKTTPLFLLRQSHFQVHKYQFEAKKNRCFLAKHIKHLTMFTHKYHIFREKLYSCIKQLSTLDKRAHQTSSFSQDSFKSGFFQTEEHASSTSKRGWNQNYYSFERSRTSLRFDVSSRIELNNSGGDEVLKTGDTRSIKFRKQARLIDIQSIYCHT